MDNLNELRQIWLTADTGGLPPSSQMASLVKKYRDQKLWKIALTITASIILFGIIVVIAFTYEVRMLTTRIGEIMMGAAGIILIFSSMSFYKQFYKLKDCSNRDYLHHMEHIKQQHLFYFKRTQGIGFILASGGTMLYAYEFVKDDMQDALMVYGGFILYMILTWFVLRPKVMKRQNGKINEQIDKLRELETQLNKDEQ